MPQARPEALARSLDAAHLVTVAGVLRLPSVREGFGMVALEANACGIPVITVDHAANTAADLLELRQTGRVGQPTVQARADAIEQALDGTTRSPHAITAHVRSCAWPWPARDQRLPELYTTDGSRAGSAGAVDDRAGNIRELQGSSP